MHGPQLGLGVSGQFTIAPVHVLKTACKSVRAMPTARRRTPVKRIHSPARQLCLAALGDVHGRRYQCVMRPRSSRNGASWKSIHRCSVICSSNQHVETHRLAGVRARDGRPHLRLHRW